MLKLNAPVPAARFTRKSLPPNPLLQMAERQSTSKSIPKKGNHDMRQLSETTTRSPGRWTQDTPLLLHCLSFFFSREADGLTEQPQEQRPLEHEDGMQVRPVQREPEHGDPGSVVLQVCHCKGINQSWDDRSRVKKKE